MVWDELKLEKVMDWMTLKAIPNIDIPTQQEIPQGVLKFSKKGLSIHRTPLGKPNAYVFSDSSPNSNSNGSQPLKLSNNPIAIASKRFQMRKKKRNNEQLPPFHTAKVHLGPHTSGTSHTAGASNIAGANNREGVSNTVGTNNPPIAVAFQGTNITLGACKLVGANFNPGGNGSVGTI